MITETETAPEARVIFDDGGGTTLQLPGYAAHYSNPKLAAKDYARWLTEGSTEGWKGGDPDDAALNPKPRDVQDGRYVVMTPDEVENAWDDYGWQNIEDFLDRLASLEPGYLRPSED